MNIVLKRVDDDELIRRIDAADGSVAVYAPGVSVAVARALQRAAQRLGDSLRVVLDVSQKSVDMGYLDPAAVEILWKLQACRRHQFLFHLQGLRMGTLFVDGGCALVYAAVARLMEDECYEQVKRCPSGLEVCEGTGMLDVRELALTPVDERMVFRFCDLRLQPAKPISEIRAEYERRLVEAEQELESARTRAESAEKRAAEAERNAVDAYKAQFRIRRVEFSVHSQPAAIGRKCAKIPSMFLVGIGNEAEKKLIANYRLFPEEHEIEEHVAAKHPGEGVSRFTDMERSIRERYLLCVPEFGSFVRTCDNDAFMHEVEELKLLGQQVGKHVREALREKISAAVDGLYKFLSVQWDKSRDPWFEEYLHKHPRERRGRYEIFVGEMRSGAKGTDALVRKFEPEITCFSTPIDETLAEDAGFRKALYTALVRHNAVKGVVKIKLEDLIALKSEKEEKGTCLDPGHVQTSGWRREEGGMT